MTHLVLVHGMGGQPSPDVLHASCRAFLAGSAGVPVPADRLRLAYWADLGGHLPEADDPGTFQTYSTAERLVIDQGLAKGHVVTAVEAKLDELLSRNTGPNDAEAAALAALVAFVTGPMTLLVLKTFLRDVYFYFRGGARERIKDRVRDELKSLPAGAKVGLIGHSLGSVVALDILASDGRRVDWFCTLGSPLGYRALQAQLGVPAATLTGLAGRWNNLADRIDPVSLDATLADDFPAAGVQDGFVINEYVNAAGHRNPHRLYGYLHAPEMGRLVRDFL